MQTVHLQDLLIHDNKKRLLEKLIVVYDEEIELGLPEAALVLLVLHSIVLLIYAQNGEISFHPVYKLELGIL